MSIYIRRHRHSTCLVSSIDLNLNEMFQQTSTYPNEEELCPDESSPMQFGETKKSNCKTIKIDSTNPISNDDKLSTLFNTTGREKNSTGPLKQWLFEHQQHPYPSETDKQELMEKTKMSLSQITVWFTNARVKMRKENKLPLNLYAKKKKKKTQDESFQLDDTLSPPFSSQNLSFNELSTSFDTEYISDGHLDESFPSNLVMICPTTIDKHLVIAYSCLTFEQLIDLHRFVCLFPERNISLSSTIDDRTTHLIIGNEEKPLLCPLTNKVFQAIARHLFVVTIRWIRECLKQRQFIDETSYEIRGDLPFGDYHDGMRHSRLAKNVHLFEHCQFYLQCRGCQGKMSKDELATLIQLCHGTLLNEYPFQTSSEDSSLITIVLSDEKIEQNRFVHGVHYLSPEWVLESIVQYTLQPFEPYEEHF